MGQILHGSAKTTEAVRVVHGGHFPSFDGERYRLLIRRYLDVQDG